MKGKTCCVTGHRDLPQNEINKVKAALEHEIDAAVTDGFTCFMSGFADGVDQYFAELVLERKQTNPALELIAVIPYCKRLDSLNKKTRTRELLEACADVVVIQEKYLPSVYSHRNRYMVEHSDRVIAVYDGREKRRYGKDDPLHTPDEKGTAGNPGWRDRPAGSFETKNKIAAC